MRSKILFGIVFFKLSLLLFYGGSVLAYTNHSCKAIFLKNELSYMRQEDGAVRESINQALSEIETNLGLIRQRSRDYFNFLKLSHSKDQFIEIETLCIGAGPACIGAAANMPVKVKEKSIILEATDNVAGVFSNANFFINTPAFFTTISKAGTPFKSDLKFPHSSQLASYLQRSLIESEINVLLKSKVVDLTPIVDNNGTKHVLVYTENGLVFRAKNILIGTGLGAGKTNVKNITYATKFQEYQIETSKNPGEYRQIMHSDAFLAAHKLQNNKIPANTKEIIIIGNGDGARISLEALALQIKDLPAGLKIKWIGGNYSNAQEYLASQSNFDRYTQLIPQLFEKNLIEGFAGRVLDVSFDSKGGVKSFVVGKEETQIIVDMKDNSIVVDATGYALNPSPLESLSKKATVNKIDTIIEGEKISEQIETDGQLQPIYIVGAASNFSKARGNSMVANPVAIFNNMWTVERLIDQLYNNNN